MSACTITRYDPDESHGRPLVMRIIGEEGQLAVHCDRETGGLWLFASGPRGGDKGGVVFGLKAAADVAAWAQEPTERPLVFNGALLLRERAEGWKLHVVPRGRPMWTITLDAAALEELRTCLREWARAAAGVRT